MKITIREIKSQEPSRETPLDPAILAQHYYHIECTDGVYHGVLYLDKTVVDSLGADFLASHIKMIWSDAGEIWYPQLTSDKVS